MITTSKWTLTDLFLNYFRNSFLLSVGPDDDFKWLFRMLSCQKRTPLVIGANQVEIHNSSYHINVRVHICDPM